jgi:hypothetical protein
MAFINRIRLPITVSKPQYIDERTVYRKANGVTKVLSNVVRKEYQAITDYLPEKWHDRLKIALAHQVVSVEGERYFGGVSQTGEYAITWPEFLDYPLGRAEFKLEVTPFNASSDNCGVCQDMNQVVTNDDFIGTIGEDETVNVAILYNDVICCSPFQISLVSFNNVYVDSVNIVGNTLQIHTKTGIPSQLLVNLATYRVTCDNGQFDEANVVADVNGSEPAECIIVTDLSLSLITATSAHAEWVSNNVGGCGFNWELFLLDDLGTPVQTGSTTDEFLDLIDLLPSTYYRLFIEADCCAGSLAPKNPITFSTNPPDELDICGRYRIIFQNSCGEPSSYAQVQYLDCNDEYQTTTVPAFATRIVCMKQIAPGNPIYYEIIFTNAGPSCDVGLNVIYLEPC